jgi:hypothetical protein
MPRSIANNSAKPSLLIEGHLCITVLSRFMKLTSKVLLLLESIKLIKVEVKALRPISFKASGRHSFYWVIKYNTSVLSKSSAHCGEVFGLTLYSSKKSSFKTLMKACSSITL